MLNRYVERKGPQNQAVEKLIVLCIRLNSSAVYRRTREHNGSLPNFLEAICLFLSRTNFYMEHSK